MTLKGGTTQACAACKYQRRKCTSECLLAPYFPADQPKVFLNVHKLFGVSNIVKILKILEPDQKKIAMDSIIIQSNYRSKYPVHGCWEEICRLQYQILWAEEELQAVYQQLETCRQQQQASMPGYMNVTSQLDLGMATPDTNALPLFDHSPQPQTYDDTVAAVAALPAVQQHSYSNSNSVDYSSVDYNSSLYLESKDDTTNPLWVQHHPYANNNNNSIVMQSQLVASQQLAIQHGTVEDYEQMHPLFDAIDDRQSYIYSKEAYESRRITERYKEVH
ncbi:PREDICTED: LOB domain-containing protein 27-like isoform X2 [Lupinus angustifolius]|uniref:LOB domain-containing protein 27-like isoform X2 n=1 Tax=Lupinus angustifolius TaxID=3871 RepID=UPI00092F42E6|nr:PREDICTED: LOB domain-containing protein 27-like isoform X2 [Lupinus angustifolius]